MGKDAKLSMIIGVAILVVAAAVSSMAFAAPPPTAEAPVKYVAMGDSVAAGSGLPGGDEECDRSSYAYSGTVAAALAMKATNLACSGAKADEGIYGEQTRRGRTIPEQLPRAFEDGVPDVMTVTIGANDMRWVQLIKQCYYIRCGFAIDTARVSAYLVDYKVELNWILTQIYKRSEGNPPLVLLNGYYDALADSACVTNGQVTSDELVWLDAQTAKLNTVIRETAARYSFAHYVRVDFTGHGICSSEPWVQGTDGLGPFHPTEAGQQALARANIAAYQQACADRESGTSSWREKTLQWVTRRFDNSN